MRWGEQIIEVRWYGTSVYGPSYRVIARRARRRARVLRRKINRGKRRGIRVVNEELELRNLGEIRRLAEDRA